MDTNKTFRCSVAARERGDSMVATAPPAQRWLLIEHEGSWPVNALDVFRPGVGRPLAVRAAAQQTRISLIRRPGRHPRTEGPIRWALADVRPGQEGIRWGTVRTAADLIEAEWHVDPGEGEPVAIVCAHSRHDVCCAMQGRPVAAALADRWPGRVWECSHLGGDRFAATMVLLPHGLCYGRVTPEGGAEILTAQERGLVRPAHLRGRCALSRLSQAAQALVREAGMGSDGIGDLLPLSEVEVADDEFEVVLSGSPDLAVRVREAAIPLGTPATCRAANDAFGREYEMVSVELLGAG
jgi:hypothetical protein